MPRESSWKFGWSMMATKLDKFCKHSKSALKMRQNNFHYDFQSATGAAVEADHVRGASGSSTIKRLRALPADWNTLGWPCWAGRTSQTTDTFVVMKQSSQSFAELAERQPSLQSPFGNGPVRLMTMKYLCLWPAFVRRRRATTRGCGHRWLGSLGCWKVPVAQRIFADSTVFGIECHRQRWETTFCYSSGESASFPSQHHRSRSPRLNRHTLGEGCCRALFLLRWIPFSCGQIRFKASPGKGEVAGRPANRNDFAIATLVAVATAQLGILWRELLPFVTFAMASLSSSQSPEVARHGGSIFIEALKTAAAVIFEL